MRANWTAMTRGRAMSAGEGSDPSSARITTRIGIDSARFISWTQVATTGSAAIGKPGWVTRPGLAEMLLAAWISDDWNQVHARMPVNTKEAYCGTPMLRMILKTK